MSSVNPVGELRKNYSLRELIQKEVDENPVKQFNRWYNEAIKCNIDEANAMSIATSSKEGIPSVRTVLLKAFDERGFVFYTNYKGKKAKELDENPVASLLFFWKELERQIRITGEVEKVSEEESAAYFKTRPRESQIGAWASDQSNEVPTREYLEEKYLEIKTKFGGEEIPLPPFWGGYRVIPNRIEFWQGRPNRLHDRICYVKKGDKWETTRLSP